MVLRRKTGKIQAKVTKSAGGGGGSKKPAAKKGKSAPAKVTGYSAVAKYKKFIKMDKAGNMVVDKDAIALAKANMSRVPVKTKSASKPSAKAGRGAMAAGAGAAMGAAVGGPDSWKSDPNDSRNAPPAPEMIDPKLIEEQNRLRNAANVPQGLPQQPQQNLQFPQQPMGMGMPMGQGMGMGMPMGQQNYMFPGQNPMQQNSYNDQYSGLIDYQNPQDYAYGPMAGQSPGQGPGQAEPQADERGGVDWRRPNQNALGVIVPDEFASTESADSDDGLLGFFSTLSTEEMIALACGGAGFLLFIIVIIVIIFKMRKNTKRKKKKSQDSERVQWKQSNPQQNGPPAGFQQHSYRSLPGEKDPDHIARIQARNLPAPPLSFSQSAGQTGITNASGTYISSDERPSMRHKD